MTFEVTISLVDLFETLVRIALRGGRVVRRGTIRTSHGGILLRA